MSFVAGICLMFIIRAKHKYTVALSALLCRSAHCLRAIVQCEEKLTISASWSKDEDISRLLQSLPNWANMAQPRQTRQKREDEEDFTRCVFMSRFTILS